MEQIEISEMIYKLAQSQKSFMKENEASNLISVICLYVEKHEGMSQENVAAALSMDKSLLARNIKKAQEAGYIRREVSPMDARKTELYITDQGKQLNKGTKEDLSVWQKNVFSALSPSEMRQLNYLLKRVLQKH